MRGSTFAFRTARLDSWPEWRGQNDHHQGAAGMARPTSGEARVVDCPAPHRMPARHQAPHQLHQRRQRTLRLMTVEEIIGFTAGFFEMAQDLEHRWPSR
jgi:hypothetical protein